MPKGFSAPSRTLIRRESDGVIMGPRNIPSQAEIVQSQKLWEGMTPYQQNQMAKDRQLIKGNPGPNTHNTTHRPPGAY